MTFYHYTSLFRLPQIREAGVILTTESNVSNRVPNAGPPVVWLTDLPDLGETTHGLEGSLYDKKQVRIEVRVPAIRWLDWAPALNRKGDNNRERLIITGGGMEAAEHWYVWPSPIRAVRWGEIHVFPDRPDRLVREAMTGRWVRAADLPPEESVGVLRRRPDVP